MLGQHDVNTIHIPDGSMLTYDGSTWCQQCIIADTMMIRVGSIFVITTVCDVCCCVAPNNIVTYMSVYHKSLACFSMLTTSRRACASNSTVSKKCGALWHCIRDRNAMLKNVMTSGCKPQSVLPPKHSCNTCTSVQWRIGKDS